MIGRFVRNGPPASVWVSYDTPLGRRAKEFTDMHEARRFYQVKLKKGKNPQVLRAWTQ